MQQQNAAKQSGFPIVLSILRYLTSILVYLRLTSIIVWLKKAGLNRLVNKITNKNLKYEPIDDEVKSKLQRHFIEDIENLEKLLGKDLSNWK